MSIRGDATAVGHDTSCPYGSPIVYYAIGGGLGHLTRARAVLHTLGITEGVTLLTASPAALDPRINGGFDVKLVPSELSGDRAAYRRWLHGMIDELAPSTIFIDTFPAGIIGEFCDFGFPQEVDVVYIARLLRWNEYVKVIDGAMPRFDRIYRVEQLTEEQEEGCRTSRQDGQRILLNLTDPLAAVNEGKSEQIIGLHHDDRPLWLVVHSGSEEEVLELVAYADDRAAMEEVEPRIVAITSLSLPGVECFDIYPATPLFPLADRIITACGFNAMRQLAPWREKHWFAPMSRRYDDQFLRAARHR